MTKENALHGWRNPNEEPEKDTVLVVVYRDNLTNMIFRTVEHMGIEHARNHTLFTLLAWQYLPVWEEE